MEWQKIEDNGGTSRYINEQGDILELIYWNSYNGDTYELHTIIDDERCAIKIHTNEFDVNSAQEQATELLNKIANGWRAVNWQWQGEGWYTFRNWINSDGGFRCDCWETSEQPFAQWIENLDSYLGNCTTNPNWDTIIEYYGNGEFPDEKIEIAPWYSDIDYEEWQRRMEEEDE